jgi:hypothetical protein
MDDVAFSVEIIKCLEDFLEDYFENLRGHHTILPPFAVSAQ